MWLLDPAFRLGTHLQRFIDKLFRQNTYRVIGELLARDRRFRQPETIPLSQVAGWRIFLEQGFDVVEIILRNGRCLQWIDVHNDLVTILRRAKSGEEITSD